MARDRRAPKWTRRGKHTTDKDHITQQVVIDANGCWVWQRCRNTGGYGLVGHSGKSRLAHRVAYEIWRGPIPEGLQIDHLCRNRACVNPAHLEAVDQRTNILRGEGATAIHARQTHCIHGHPLEGANLCKPRPGTNDRACYTCYTARRKRWERAQAERKRA